MSEFTVKRVKKEVKWSGMIRYMLAVISEGRDAHPEAYDIFCEELIRLAAFADECNEELRKEEKACSN